MATHSSMLAWENPMDAGVWQVHGLTRVRHNLITTPPPPTVSLVRKYLQGSTVHCPFLAMYILKSESESRSVMSSPLRPHELYSPWNSPGQNTGVGSLFLLQGIFPNQGSNSGLPHCRQILYQLSHQGSPRLYRKRFLSVDWWWVSTPLHNSGLSQVSTQMSQPWWGSALSSPQLSREIPCFGWS